MGMIMIFLNEKIVNFLRRAVLHKTLKDSWNIQGFALIQVVISPFLCRHQFSNECVIGLFGWKKYSRIRFDRFKDINNNFAYQKILNQKFSSNRREKLAAKITATAEGLQSSTCLNTKSCFCPNHSVLRKLIASSFCSKWEKRTS